MVSVAVSKLGCTELFRRAMSESWQQKLPWRSAEEAHAASHASHCWQHVCVPAIPCTCTPDLWNSPAPSAGNTGFYLSRSVATKQSGHKPSRLPNLGTDTGMCVQDTPPWYQRLEAPLHWHNVMGKHTTKRYRWSCWSILYLHAWRRKDITLNIC